MSSSAVKWLKFRSYGHTENGELFKNLPALVRAVRICSIWAWPSPSIPSPAQCDRNCTPGMCIREDEPQEGLATGISWASQLPVAGGLFRVLFWVKQDIVMSPATLHLHRGTARRDSQVIRTESSTDLPKGTDFIWNKEWANSCPGFVKTMKVLVVTT